MTIITITRTIGILRNTLPVGPRSKIDKSRTGKNSFVYWPKPFPRQTLPIKILDVGAGYGALTQFMLKYFFNATAVCQDGSEEMIALGRERMADLTGRFDYVLCDFSRHGWSQLITGPFEAVVSSIAIPIGSEYHSRDL
jgi:SAM-dependent methyltransferase